LLDFYRSQHRYAEVEKVYLRTIDAVEKKHGPDHPSLRDTLDKLASLYELNLSRPEKAEPMYRRCLAIVEKAHGADHLEVQTPLRRLAEFLDGRRRYKEAEPLLARIVAITEKARGPEHLSLAGVSERTGFEDVLIGNPLDRLASNYERQRRYDEAEKLYLRQLAIVEKARGPDHEVARGRSRG
jgi:tetratricopeptide (TPR) repeat protein